MSNKEYEFSEGCFNIGESYDKLEKYVKERLDPETILLDGADREYIERHLSKCDSCKGLFKKMAEDDADTDPVKITSAEAIKELLRDCGIKIL